ncbi:UNVERIFIED_CONTAM: hypothetical protein GTU68_044050 [Idotea baltica]|nr:hypothetical protein [Idotea baltica]
MFFQCVMAVVLFYCAHWQTYVSGTLRFGFVDVTEAQFGVMIILLLSSIFGSQFWSAKILGNVDLLYIYTFCGLMQILSQIVTYFPLILWKGAGKNGSTIAGTSVLSPIVPLFLMVAPAVIVAWKSPHGVYLNNPALYLLTFGFVAARVTNRLVVAHMTKSEMAYTDASMLGPASLFLNQYFNTPISEHVLLWIVCIYVTYDLIKYCREVCLDICDHLHIYLFVIEPRGSAGEKNGNVKYNTRSKSKAKGGC